MAGTDQVYYQPPPNIQMTYPCVIYSLESHHKDHGDNFGYFHRKRYQITVIDRNPESPIVDAVEELEYCSFSSSFSLEGLNHFHHTLYF